MPVAFFDYRLAFCYHDWAYNSCKQLFITNHHFHLRVCNCMCAVQNPITAQITKSAGQALLSPLELNKGQGKLHTCLGLEPELPHYTAEAVSSARG